MMMQTYHNIWRGQTVIIVGGGCSLWETDLSPLSRFWTIAVNCSYLFSGLEYDALWFGDYQFYKWHWEMTGLMKRWGKGIKATCCNESVPHQYFWQFKRTKQMGIDADPDAVAWNLSSGLSAINFAFHLGVKRVVLVAFDMDYSGNAKNWHDQELFDHKVFLDLCSEKSEKQTVSKKGYEADNPNKIDFGAYKRFMRPIPTLVAEAKAVGLEILNASVRTAIPETLIPRVSLNDL